MAHEAITAVLGGWEGFEIVTVRREPAQADVRAARVIIELAPVAGHPHRCSRCAAVVAEVHEVTPRWVQDLPILDAETWLVVPRARVQCPQCGPTVEALPWLDRYARMTRRFAESVARLCQVLPVKHVAAWFGLGWDTVKAIDVAALRQRSARRISPASG